MSALASEALHSVPECYIETRSEFEEFVDSLSGPDRPRVCSIDTEADSMHSYETKLCLVQFSVPGQLAIIDPLAIGVEGLSGFPDFIDSFDDVWMHGADYDISMFHMTFGWCPRRILDTQIAARLLGVMKFGLGNLLEQEYGVKVSKQSQKADWSRRPLSEKMLDYAYNDVRYLIDMGERFRDRLREAGRDDWFLECCDAGRSSVLDRDDRPEKEAWRLSGWGKLSTRGLNYLRHLWMWRDEECRRLDRPAFKFLSNQELVRMTKNLEQGLPADPPHYLKPHYRRRLERAIADANEVPKKDYPSKRISLGGIRLEIDEAAFEKIRDFRNSKAEELGLEGTMIATRNNMERIASTNIDEAERFEGLLDWQRELLAPVLRMVE